MNSLSHIAAAGRAPDEGAVGSSQRRAPGERQTGPRQAGEEGEEGEEGEALGRDDARSKRRNFGGHQAQRSRFRLAERSWSAYASGSLPARTRP